ncbi:MAG: sialate O-acetylesterase [Chthoniobacter sp.]|uniref:sialate O-acetylesterase n=1 Tax=Chthoniobacter sp. TaxID=2510640 RepID=UPI0032ABD41B
MKKSLSIMLLFTALGVVNVCGDVKVPAIFSDHMVLQSDAAANVWGWAEPGETVSVSIADRTKTTSSDANGNWALKLDKLKAGAEPRTLTVKGKNTVTIHDVLVGEVWLCSGQSNMEMQVKGGMHGQVDNADEEIAAAKYPEIRMFVFRQTYAIYDLPAPPESPMSDRPGEWLVCSPETVARFSATAYFFGRDMHRELGVPIGLINSSVGGTPIEAWTSLDAQHGEPALHPVLDEWQQKLANYNAEREQQKFTSAKTVWLKQRAAAQAKGEPAPKAPLPFKNLRVMEPGRLFNGMIAPLVPYSIRGVIWYQGERNADGPHGGFYGVQLKTLIADWRGHWGDEFYFAWVQLPKFKAEQRLPSEANGWGVSIRDEMRKTLSVPRTGMAITIDLGGVAAGHPTNKADFARRLSRLALHDVYQKPTEIWSGPLFKSAQREGNKMTIAFDHAAGLKAAVGDLKGFAVASNDQKFAWANARIMDGKVVVWSDTVSEPAAVRYDWASNPIGNLVNAAGLPASPFRTDDWK